MKRLLDTVLVLIFLPLWGFLAAFTAILVLITMGCPVLFRQERAGKGGKSFTLLKFRTMRNDEGTDAERITKIGRFLRATSLDELPQLFQVITGKMALVGPRPLPVAYLTRYSAEQARRHEVRPGITGWAQVNGRNELSWQKKFELDIWYVDHRSIALDVKILFLTIWKTLSRDGINHPGSDTMEEFRGN